MKRILVSYKHEDKERVTALIHVLQQQGLEVWWDRDLQGGEAWREHIETELNQDLGESEVIGRSIQNAVQYGPEV